MSIEVDARAAVRRGIPGAGAVAFLQRRAGGRFELDEWGLDPELAGLLAAAGVDWPLTAQGRAALVAVRLVLESHREATARGAFDGDRFRAALDRRGRLVFGGPPSSWP